MDDLARIERSYGCVQEYFRSQTEAEERDDELQETRAERYRTNREKVNSTPLRNLIWCGGYGACSNCPYADCDTQRDETDDMELVICNAPESHNCETRNETRESLQ